MHDEPCTQLFEATNRAAELLDDLDAYAVEWELFAEAAGNPLAFAIFHSSRFRRVQQQAPPSLLLQEYLLRRILLEGGPNPR